MTNGTTLIDTSLYADPDRITPCLPLNYALTVKDVVAAVTMLLFTAVPMIAAIYYVGLKFGVGVNLSLQYQPYGRQEWQFIAALMATITASVLIGKYTWLIAMCLILTRSNVGPLIAFGRPRRISHFDRALIKRLYRAHGPTIESRLRPTLSIKTLYRYHIAIYAFGAVFAAAIHFLPIMHGDHRIGHLAVFFAVIAVILMLIEAIAMKSGTRR